MTRKSIEKPQKTPIRRPRRGNEETRRSAEETRQRASTIKMPIPVTEWEKGENKKPARRDDSPTG